MHRGMITSLHSSTRRRVDGGPFGGWQDQRRHCHVSSLSHHKYHLDGYLDLVHQYMSGYQSGGAYAHTGSSNPPTVADVNDEILREFDRAIFTVDLTAHGAPLQADPVRLCSVTRNRPQGPRGSHPVVLRRRKSHMSLSHTFLISSFTLQILASLICATSKIFTSMFIMSKWLTY
ncbi:hypothetical protein EDB89DRAFT_1927785 [Lactarius sanguifluus]|nr:hypothetical protein EDB89DRAFT_1927785 [Lactarius sanguifluus]